MVNLVADATDDIAVANVEFAVDGAVVGVDSDGSDGWTFAWDSSGAADGPVSITATASDGAQTASDSISVSVDNLGPTTTLLTPADGATVSGTVTISADVVDAVGVAQTEFFADGISLGVDNDGSDGWSLDWDSSTAAAGPVLISATGSDLQGRTSSDDVTVTVVSGTTGVVVLVVANPGALNAGDTAVRDRIESLGYTVSVVDDAAMTPGTAAGAELVIVASSVNSFVLGDSLAGIPQPLLVAKPWLLDDLGLTGPISGVDFGTLSAQTVTIVDPGHPIAAGYSGDVTIATRSITNSFGVPGAAADVISSAGGQPATFVYAAGTTLADASTAAGCRIHHSLFGSTPTAFTGDGWGLFDNVIGYAANNCAAPPVDLPPTVAITAPLDGATVLGTVDIVADASDDSAVTQVEFFVDAVSVGIDTDGLDGWSVPWDTTTSVDGAVTVSATATDDASQTADDSISVTVDNLGPTISITNPADGATVHSDVTITADVGADPTVTQVEFFADAVSIGVDIDGGDGWSLLWDTTTVTSGPVVLSATATDTSLRTATDSITVTVDNAAAGFVTMIVGNAATLSSSDTALRDRFAGNGYVVAVVDDNNATLADASGASFVYISSSVNSNVLRATFAPAAVPVWVAKPWSLDDMGMTATVSGTDYGTTSASEVTIVDETHPLAAGYTGVVVVTPTLKTLSWGLPAVAAQIVATANTLATSFVYPSGATLADSSIAAGCRIHSSAFQSAVLSWTTDAWALFDAAAAYASGDCS